ncbi:MAG: prepilin peptidase [Alphaproteobacteria bacterium]|nr:prepilin peptidase [Alphaproteobacteria bacterium]
MTSLVPPIWLALVAAPAAVWAIERGAARIEPGLPTAIPTWLAMLALAAGIAAIAAIGVDGSDAWIAAGLGWTLLALARIDLAHGLLPDILTLPLAAAGLALAGLRDPGLLPEAALGAAVGFGALALIGWAYRRWRGRDGLGLGDAKLLGAGGAWLGATALPLTVCLAATAALVAVLAARLVGRRLDEAGAIPFGPFLCLAVWIVFRLREGMLRA